MPIKYYFLIYADQALNGIDLYYSRYYYVILIVYSLLARDYAVEVAKALS